MIGNILSRQGFNKGLADSGIFASGELAIKFIIIGALSLISLVALIIYIRRRSKLYLFYFLYGFSTLLLLVLQYWFDQKLFAIEGFSSEMLIYSRLPEFLQMVSLWAYINFVITILDLEHSKLRIAKMLKWLSVFLIVWGIVEVLTLLITQDIKLYELLLGVSSSVLFPIFILVIVFLALLVKHHLIKYVILSNSIFVGILVLGFVKSYFFADFDFGGLTDTIFSLPFATLLEAIVLSFALAAKIEFDAEKRVLAERKLAKVEMAALRSQMNPHFLFNSMNSIRAMILIGENKKAEKYLVSFSKLLRQILEFSREETISLEDEIEIISLYLSLESTRFDKGFTYKISIDPNIELDSFRVPPLLLQPFVENALIHGLFQSEKLNKELDLTIIANGDRNITIFIKDNGVGRNQVSQLSPKPNKQSLGTQITKERIDLYNRNDSGNIAIQTIDELIGTKVIIELSN